jgi:hypothetical protein
LVNYVIVSLKSGSGANPRRSAARAFHTSHPLTSFTPTLTFRGRGFQEYNAKKWRQCVDFSLAPGTPTLLLISACLSEPLDALSAGLQRADEVGYSMWFARNPAGGVQKAARDLFLLLHPQHPASTDVTRRALPLLDDHFGFDRETYLSFLAATTYVASMVLGGLCLAKKLL